MFASTYRRLEASRRLVRIHFPGFRKDRKYLGQSSHSRKRLKTNTVSLDGAPIFLTRRDHCEFAYYLRTDSFSWERGHLSQV